MPGTHFVALEPHSYHSRNPWPDAAKRLAVKSLNINRIFASFHGNFPSCVRRLPASGERGKSAQHFISRIRLPVRISFAPFALALASLIAFTPIAVAQDTKADPELPDSEAGKLGPRIGAQGGAQGGQPAEAPKTETIATHGAWAVQCTAIPGAKDNAKTCGMIQNVKNDKNENIAISIVVSRIKRDGKSATFMRVLAPIGVYLPTGIPMEIDGTALASRLTFSRCLPRMCEGFGEASPESLAKFKKGNKAIFYLYDRPGNSYPMAVSLEGFGNGLAELDKL